MNRGNQCFDVSHAGYGGSAAIPDAKCNAGSASSIQTHSGRPGSARVPRGMESRFHGPSICSLPSCAHGGLVQIMNNAYSPPRSFHCGAKGADSRNSEVEQDRLPSKKGTMLAHWWRTHSFSRGKMANGMSVGLPGKTYQLIQRLSVPGTAVPLKDFVNIGGSRDTTDVKKPNPLWLLTARNDETRIEPEQSLRFEGFVN